MYDFQTLSKTLSDAGIAAPSLLVDLDLLDANIARANAVADAGKPLRVVAKSLPSAPLLRHVRAGLRGAGFMTFAPAMIPQIDAAFPGADQLLGRPAPVGAAAKLLSKHPQLRQSVQWLIDTPERLDAYAALAEDGPLRLSIEIDIGLHRGGVSDLDTLDAMAAQIAAHPNLSLSGLMGYEAHFTKLPGLLRKGAIRRAQSFFDAAIARVCAQTGQGPEALCLNTAGSSSFHLYGPEHPQNDLSLGSVTVLPSDFDKAGKLGFVPAAFIATPILKALPRNPVPGLEVLTPLLGKDAIVVSGGYWKASPVWPEGAAFSSVFGRSSNQEIWTCPAGPDARAGGFAFLRPTQSEEVLMQFGRILTLRNGKIADRWDVL